MEAIPLPVVVFDTGTDYRIMDPMTFMQALSQANAQPGNQAWPCDSSSCR